MWTCWWSSMIVHQSKQLANCLMPRCWPNEENGSIGDVEHIFQNNKCTVHNMQLNIGYANSSNWTNLTGSKSGSYVSEYVLLLLKTEQAMCNADTLKWNLNNQLIESMVLVTQQSKPTKSNSNVSTYSVCKHPDHPDHTVTLPSDLQLILWLVNQFQSSVWLIIRVVSIASIGQQLH